MRTLSEDLDDFLEAERDIDVPAPAQRQRMFARLEPLLVPVALAAGAASTAAATDASGSAAVGTVLKAKIGVAVVSAALMGGVVGATGHAYFAAPPARTPVAPLASRSNAIPSPPEPSPPPPDEPAAAASAAAAPSQSAGRRERARPVGSLRAERLLLETASAALMRGDPESAIVALRQHARRFPSGALAEEREVLLARALAARTPR